MCKTELNGKLICKGCMGLPKAQVSLQMTIEIITKTLISCFHGTDPFAKQRKVFFKGDKIPFDGVPFSIIGTKVFDCQHGPDRKKSFKARHAEDKVCWL